MSPKCASSWLQAGQRRWAGHQPAGALVRGAAAGEARQALPGRSTHSRRTAAPTAARPPCRPPLLLLQLCSCALAAALQHPAAAQPSFAAAARPVAHKGWAACQSSRHRLGSCQPPLPTPPPRSTPTAACESWASCPSGTACTSRAGTTAAQRTATASTRCTGCRVRRVPAGHELPRARLLAGPGAGCLLAKARAAGKARLGGSWRPDSCLPCCPLTADHRGCRLSCKYPPSSRPAPAAHPFLTHTPHPSPGVLVCADVNGQPTPDLDSFLAVVRQLPDGADVRVRLVHFESNKSKVGWGGVGGGGVWWPRGGRRRPGWCGGQRCLESGVPRAVACRICYRTSSRSPHASR